MPDNHNFTLIDCQIESSHLFTLGATTIPKNQFINIVKQQCSDKRKFIEWPKNKIAVNELLKI
jgi:Leu/Phe-tRNA-protein transferase